MAVLKNDRLYGVAPETNGLPRFDHAVAKSGSRKANIRSLANAQLMHGLLLQGCHK
jgi:hypothetical protein